MTLELKSIVYVSGPGRRKPARIRRAGPRRRRPGIEQRQLLRPLATYLAVSRAPSRYAARGGVTLENRAVPLVTVTGPKPSVQQLVRQNALDAPTPGALQPGMRQPDEPGAVGVAETPAAGGGNPLQHHRAGRNLQPVQLILFGDGVDPLQVAQQNALRSGP